METTHRDTHKPADAAAVLFHAVLDTVGEGIITIDSDQYDRRGEQGSSTHIWGYTQDELIGKRIELLMPEKYRERHAAGFKRYHRNPRAAYHGDSSGTGRPTGKTGRCFPWRFEWQKRQLAIDYCLPQLFAT